MVRLDSLLGEFEAALQQEVDKEKQKSDAKRQMILEVLAKQSELLR